jgi:hypothetical protein
MEPSNNYLVILYEKLPGTKKYKQDLYKCGSVGQVREVLGRIFGGGVNLTMNTSAR